MSQISFYTSSFFAIFLLFLLSFTSHLHAQGRQETIVRSGETVTDGNGTYDGFNEVMLIDNGMISFRSELLGTSGGGDDDSGIFAINNIGDRIQRARTGSIAHDSNGIVSRVRNFGLNESGVSLFHSTFRETAGGSTDDTGLYIAFNSQFTVGREGATVPGGDGQLGHFFLNPKSYGFNRSTATSFSSYLANTPGGQSDDNRIYNSYVNPSEYVREGDAAPNNLGSFSAFGSRTDLNDAGEISFVGYAGDTTGVYRGTQNNITPILIEGDLAPDGNGTFSSTSMTVINNSGQIAFKAFFSNTSNGNSDNEAIVVADGSSVVQIAREGKHAGGNGVFNSFLFDTVKINNQGQVGFAAELRETEGASSDNSAVYRSSASGNFLTEIAREGDQTGDGRLANLRFVDIAMNERGNVAFSTLLTDTENERGIFVGDGIELVTVAQSGQELDGSTISAFGFQGGQGTSNGLNGYGQIAYTAYLEDGRKLLQLWTPDLHWRRTYGSNWSSSSAWTLGIAPDEIYDVYIDPESSMTVDGNVDATVNSLTVGGGDGIATLRMESGAIIFSKLGTTIQSTGVLTGDGTIAGANVDNLGVVFADNLRIGDTLKNAGVVRGSGRIDANFDNTSDGEFRVASGEYMRLTGASFYNAGKIENLGGELEVSQHIYNERVTGLITGRDSIMRFNGGVENNGAMAFTNGINDVFGDINNRGVISVSGGAEAIFYDDIVQDGVFEVAAFGTRTSSAVVLRDFSAGGFTGGGDLFLQGDLRPGHSPASVLMDGNLYLGGGTITEIELAGLDIGEFDQLVVTGDLSLAGSLQVSLIDGFVLSNNQTFEIGNVSGDLLGQFTNLDDGDLVGNFGGFNLFITYAGGDGNDIALFTNPVPEPGIMGMATILGIGMMLRRRRRSVLANAVGTA